MPKRRIQEEYLRKAFSICHPLTANFLLSFDGWLSPESMQRLSNRIDAIEGLPMGSVKHFIIATMEEKISPRVNKVFRDDLEAGHISSRTLGMVLSMMGYTLKDLDGRLFICVEFDCFSVLPANLTFRRSNQQSDR